MQEVDPVVEGGTIVTASDSVVCDLCLCDGTIAALVTDLTKDDKTEKIHDANLRDGADYSPYEGLEIKGWPVSNNLRRNIVIRDGVHKAAGPADAYIRRV
ncbi:hypothetical protein [Pseudoruegeria sp. SK021]|uniref:hypothetical protein n=1 Tax=Pseudoruegeria sp. SK021 TaxID=1933035 RepID=UPI000A21C29E|nr:hypothetical protein [Pseudoruegeria sp. SK021]OSP54004.1 hypothetical protein BV911_14835 [Pseudoruegeria sp. SK021]